MLLLGTDDPVRERGGGRRRRRDQEPGIELSPEVQSPSPRTETGGSISEPENRGRVAARGEGRTWVRIGIRADLRQIVVPNQDTPLSQRAIAGE